MTRALRSRSLPTSVLAAGALAATLAAPAAGQGPARRWPARILDAHQHLEAGDAAALAAPWREAGISATVVHLPQGVSEPPASSAAPGPVRWCAGVGADPDTAALGRALAAGRARCLKIYLGYVHRWASDPVYEPVYALAARYRVPVVFHTGDTESERAKLKYADPLTVDEVAVDHPDVVFVIAHCGNPWIQSAAEVAYKNPNVYLECSALMTGDLDEVAPAARATYVVDVIRWVLGYVEDPAKLMFATDWPLVDPAAYVRAYMDAVPEADWDAVFYGNAARVFGF